MASASKEYSALNVTVSVAHDVKFRLALSSNAAEIHGANFV